MLGINNAGERPTRRRLRLNLLPRSVARHTYVYRTFEAHPSLRAPPPPFSHPTRWEVLDRMLIESMYVQHAQSTLTLTFSMSTRKTATSATTGLLYSGYYQTVRVLMFVLCIKYMFFRPESTWEMSVYVRAIREGIKYIKLDEDIQKKNKRKGKQRMINEEQLEPGN